MITVRIGEKECLYYGNLESYFEKFRRHIIGNNKLINTPYGKKKLIYSDWTASGRLYRPIEKTVSERFGPFMANTHTESNSTSSVMTLAYKEAQTIIKNHVQARKEDVIITCGSGMTAAVNKFQRLLGLKFPERFINQISIPEEERPVVFITHLEHHSNHTSWLETVADVEIVRPSKNGNVDIDHLKELLDCYKKRKLKIGSFSACSNVTGIMTPYHQLARVMHEYGGICLVDFAASAPYTDISMHPEDEMEKLDAIFFSPHKFLGGPGTSGVLIFDSALYQNSVPDHPGGGTVIWTDPWGQHKYFDSIELREDGGTPAILQTIRIALCIKLKEQMGTDFILKREKEILGILLPGIQKIKGINVLEKNAAERLGIISFQAENIHYNLIVKLLNDRFGYQVRGGCSCAGTYGHYLLKINKTASKSIFQEIEKGDMSEKPGWVRVSVHPTMSNEEVYGFLQSMKMIMENIDEWKKDYSYDKGTNDFQFIGEARNMTYKMFQLDNP
ncbi:aminotransferase class V-fold PLP-dependent enzyme [Bacillus sp. MUM 13]|uniref:aminotransferase class V-fold PLP-dependent enzyme n=1 Tax=Bacillus sp. MUM 13 TaxID=1678001 RepID=UPI0008F5928D|nr:aminotransferase class V-fold PLP-dependent enzyme [Bacillus sp. MUM 13]OIK14947.1 selenocysteine lyase [Bacillus sp. MUM 13]